MNAKELREQFNTETGIIAHQSPWAYAKWIFHQAKSKKEGLQKHSDRVALLVDYTNWLLGEGYVDSDVYSEEPSVIDSFLAAFGKEDEG